jgi:hypothetical protein
MDAGQLRYPFGKDVAGTGRSVAGEPSHAEPDEDGFSLHGQVSQFSLVAAMDALGRLATERARGARGGSVDHQRCGIFGEANLLDAEARGDGPSRGSAAKAFIG